MFKYILNIVCCLCVSLSLGSAVRADAGEDGPRPLETPPSATEPGVTDVEDGSAGISVDLSFHVWNKYVGSSGGIVFHDDPVVQSELTVSFEPGLYFTLWNSTGLNGGGFSSDFGDEFDITVGWEGEIGFLNVDAGVAYFDIFPVGKFSLNDSDVVQPFLNLSHDFEINEQQTISPYVRTESMFGASNNNQGETYVHIGADHLIKLSGSLSFGQRLDICYDPGVFGFDNGFIGDYSLSFTWSPEDWFEVNVTPLRLVVPLGHIDDERGVELIFGLGVTFHF